MDDIDDLLMKSSGMGGELMSRMEALNDEYQETSDHSFMARYSNSNQRGYGLNALDEEEGNEGAMGDQGRNYDEFEIKLRQGILDAPGLNLHQVPPSVFDNKPPLSIIYLKGNQIHELPEYFFDELPLLSWLDLRDNKLTGLPALNNCHEALKVLLLQGNRIRALPHTLGLGINIKAIGLTGNPLTNPPDKIREQGCKAMLAYLRGRMLTHVSIDEGGEFDMIPTIKPEEDEELRKDLRKTASKRVPSTLSVRASATSINVKTDEEKKIDRLKYTWDLWKQIPFEGRSRVEIFEKSMEEVRTEVVSKLNRQQEAILQKFKNTDALKNWRSETRKMQNRTSPLKDLCTLANAPFGNKFNQISQTTKKPLNPEDFQQEISDCWEKLKNFALNPAPMSNTELALNRLREVEDIQQRLMDIKLTVKCGPTPI